LEVESYGSFQLVRILRQSAASWARKARSVALLPIVGSYGGRFAGGSYLRQSAALGAWYFPCALLCKRVFAASSEARPALLTDQAVPKILQATLQSLPVLVDDISHDRSSNS
jgi:hypothetical protein